jgi:hypothetical protein
VPTAVVQRHSSLLLASRLADPTRPTLFRVGPYDVLRPLVRGPGVFLAEARGPNQEATLLQMAALRATVGEADALARRHLERALALETAGLFADGAFEVMAHGGASRPDGVRVLFWALPWRPEAERLGNAPMFVEGSEHLVVLARSLAQHLARRHVTGGLEPLLTEHTVAIRSDGAEGLAAPVSVPGEWLAPESRPPRRAPEEQRSGKLERTGDLWRLGHLLAALAHPFSTVPQGVSRLIARLVDVEPARRPPRATEVVVELDAIHADLSRGAPLVPLEETPTISWDEMPAAELTRLMQSALGQSTPAPVPDAEALAPTLQDMPVAVLAAGRVSPAVNDTPMMDRVPPWAFFFELDELRRFLRLVAADLTRRELDFLFGTGVVQLALPDGGSFYYLGLVQLGHACHRSPPDRWPELIAADFDALLSATAQAPARRAFGDVDAGSRDTVVLTPMSPESTLPEGEAGPTLLLPSVTALPVAPAPRVATPPPAPSRAPAPPPRPAPAHEPPPPDPAARPRPGRGRMYVLGGAAALLLFGGLLVGARSLAAFAPPQQVRVSDQVEVLTEPSGAVLVAEADGRILGPAPQTFWVGPAAGAAVLVTAPDHLPQRITLPARGRVTVRLLPRAEGAERCALDLPADAQARYEGLGAQWAGPTRLVVAGAAVLRARSEDAPGAWLVQCGAGRADLAPRPLASVSLQVAAQPARIEGRPAGPEATERAGAFTRVAVGEAEAWVPTLSSVRLSN